MGAGEESALGSKAGASKPKVSTGSAIWNGDSTLRGSGSFTGFGVSAAGSSTTVKGDSSRAAGAKGLDAALSFSESLTTAKGESTRFAGWPLGKLSKMPRFVLMVTFTGEE